MAESIPSSRVLSRTDMSIVLTMPNARAARMITMNIP